MINLDLDLFVFVYDECCLCLLLTVCNVQFSMINALLIHCQMSEVDKHA